jgi:hypothetical protein
MFLGRRSTLKCGATRRSGITELISADRLCVSLRVHPRNFGGVFWAHSDSVGAVFSGNAGMGKWPSHGPAKFRE